MKWKNPNVELPPEKTWVKVTDKYIGIREHFYWSSGTSPDKWPNGVVLKWRFIIHSIFNPIIEAGYVLELPILNDQA